MNVFELFGTIAIDTTKANKSLDQVGKNAKAAGKNIQDAFSRIGQASVKIGKAVIGAGVAVGTAWVAAIEGTRDYRTAMAKLDTAFVTNGHSAETATRTYQDLFAVLGDTDVAVEAANHLAVMCDSEEELKMWTEICTGVFATFGDSLPIEALTEAANETAKTGVVTGVLADALNWAGISEEDFNRKLRACRTDQERQALIMNHLTLAYQDASKQYQLTAEDIMAANRAQESWNSAMAAIGKIGEPILTAIKQKVADMVLAAVPHLENFITKFKEIENVWTDAIWPLVQSTFKVAFGIDVPEWSDIEADITTWWSGTAKPALEQNFKAIFGVDPPEWSAVSENITTWWSSTAKPALEQNFKTLFGVEPPKWSDVTPAIQSWWTNDVTPNVKDFFKVFVGLEPSDADSSGTAWGERLKTWFDGIVASRTDMAKLTVGLLMHDTDETGVRWSEAIADWFHGMVGEIGEQLQVTFSVLTPTPEETEKINKEITEWLHGSDGKSGIVGVIANAISFPFELAFQECVNVWEDFQKWLESISQTGKISTETYEESAWAKGEKYNYRLWGYSQEELALMQDWIDATRRRENLDFSSTVDEVLEVEGAVTEAYNAMEKYMGKERADQLHSDYQSWLAGQLDADSGIVLDIPLELMEGTAEDLQTDINGLGLEAPVKLVPDYSGMSGVSTLGGSTRGRSVNVPTVHWNAEGGIFDRATIFNTRAGLQGVGEAGAEAVAPISVLQKYVADAVASQNAGMVAVLQSMLSTLNQISANTAGGHQVVLDSGVLVGQIAPAMDVQLGTISGRRGRRN